MLLHDRIVELIQRLFLLPNFAIILVDFAIDPVHPVVIHIFAHVGVCGVIEGSELAEI